MTTEVLRNMIYAGSPALDGLRYVVLDEVHYLQDPLPRPGVGGGDHPPAARGRPRVPVGHGVERRGGRGVDRDGARADRGDHRGAPAGRARQPVPGRRPRRPTTSTCCRRSSTAAPEPRGRPPRRRTRRRRRRPARGRPRRRFVHARGASRWSSACRAEGMLPAIYFIFSRAGCDEAVTSVPRRRAAAHRRRRSGGASAAIAEERTVDG